MPGIVSQPSARRASLSRETTKGLPIKTDGRFQRRTMRCPMKIKRGRLLAITVLVGLTAALPPAASGHNATLGSEHSLSFAATRLSGQLSSAVADCMSGRSITVYRTEAAGDTAVDAASTDAQGAWSAQAGGPQAGDYYAVAARKVLKQPGHKHTCNAARSNTVSVPPDS